MACVDDIVDITPVDDGPSCQPFYPINQSQFIEHNT